MNNTLKENNSMMSEDRIKDLTQSAYELSDKALETSKNAVDKSVEFAKEYPVHTAVGAGVVGFLAGALINKILK